MTLTPFFIMTAVVIFIIGLSKGGLGGTLGVLATPLMTLVLPADQVIGLLLPILIIADIFAVAAHWQHWNTQLLLLLLPGALIGTVLGTIFIASISPETLRRGIGVIVLLFVIYKLFELRILSFTKYTPRNWHGVTAGAIAGVSSTLAHTGGPPIAIYLLMQHLRPGTFVATTALFFAVLNWIKVPFYFYVDLFDFSRLWGVAWLIPILPLSVWLGKQISDKVDKVIFDRIIVFVLAASVLFLLR